MKLKVGMQIIHSKNSEWIIEISDIKNNKLILLYFNPKRSPNRPYKILKGWRLDEFQEFITRGIWQVVDNIIDFDMIRLLYG